MINIYIILLSFFNIIFTADFLNTLIVEKNLFIENQDISASSIAFNGITNINTNHTIKNIFFVENTENNTSIYFNKINEISDIFQLGLNENNNLVAISKKNQISNRKIDEFDSISTNFIVPLIPLADNQTIIINNSPSKGNTYFGKLSDQGEENIILLTQNFFLNTNNVKTTENATSITLETNIDSESVNSEGIILTNKINSTSNIETKNLSANTMILNREDLTLLSDILEITSSNSPSTIINTIKIIDFAVPRNIPPLYSSVIGFLVIDKDGKLGISKKLSYINTLNAVNCSNTTPDNSSINITILNSLLNKSEKSIQTQNIEFKKINVDSINLNNYIVEIPNNTIETDQNISFVANNKIEIGTLNVKALQSSSEKLYLPKNIFIPNMPIIPLANNAKLLVLNINNDGIWGYAPINSIENIEHIEDFILSKKEFLNATKIIIGEAEDKKLIRTLCNKKIQNSKICSLIIDYDENENPIYYDNEGIVAIAASQMNIIKNEIKDYEEEIKKITLEFHSLFQENFS